MTAYVERDGRRQESLRSAPLSLQLGAASDAAFLASGQQRFVMVDGVELRATVATLGLEDATDLAVLPDGRVLVAERGGRVRTYSSMARSEQTRRCTSRIS